MWSVFIAHKTVLAVGCRTIVNAAVLSMFGEKTHCLFV